MNWFYRICLGAVFTVTICLFFVVIGAVEQNGPCAHTKQVPYPCPPMPVPPAHPEYDGARMEKSLELAKKLGILPSPLLTPAEKGEEIDRCCHLREIEELQKIRERLDLLLDRPVPGARTPVEFDGQSVE